MILLLFSWEQKQREREKLRNRSDNIRIDIKWNEHKICNQIEKFDQFTAGLMLKIPNSRKCRHETPFEYIRYSSRQQLIGSGYPLRAAPSRMPLIVFDKRNARVTTTQISRTPTRMSICSSCYTPMSKQFRRHNGAVARVLSPAIINVGETVGKLTAANHRGARLCTVAWH